MQPFSAQNKSGDSIRRDLLLQGQSQQAVLKHLWFRDDVSWSNQSVLEGPVSLDPSRCCKAPHGCSQAPSGTLPFLGFIPRIPISPGAVVKAAQS